MVRDHVAFISQRQLPALLYTATIGSTVPDALRTPSTRSTASATYRL